MHNYAHRCELLRKKESLVKKQPEKASCMVKFGMLWVLIPAGTATIKEEQGDKNLDTESTVSFRVIDQCFSGIQLRLIPGNRN